LVVVGGIVVSRNELTRLVFCLVDNTTLVFVCSTQFLVFQDIVVFFKSRIYWEGLSSLVPTPTPPVKYWPTPVRNHDNSCRKTNKSLYPHWTRPNRPTSPSDSRPCNYFLKSRFIPTSLLISTLQVYRRVCGPESLDALHSNACVPCALESFHQLRLISYATRLIHSANIFLCDHQIKAARTLATVYT
jgi:hypothetical protein